MAAEFRRIDAADALTELDRLAAEITPGSRGAREQVDAVRVVLGLRNKFLGDREHYDDPDNSMLDRVLARRKGLPILLSVVYVEVARRAGINLHGVGLPGHYVVGHFEHVPPLLVDPFAGGERLKWPVPAEVRPWTPHQTALRMLNNLVGSYVRRGDLAHAIRAAELRHELPLAEAENSSLMAELRSLRARLN